MKDKGTLVVISGFSGAGKGTVSKALVEKFGYSLSVSATTRQPREGEQDGREYYFKSEDDFLRLIDYNGFIEYAQYVDHYYGTPRKFVEDELEAGHVVILEIEVQGAMKIKEQYPDAILLFITAPSIEVLKNRLIGRGTETAEVVEKRMRRAAEEAESIEQYEFIVSNEEGKLEDCMNTIHSIIESESCRITKRKETYFMLHPSYTELMEKINKEGEQGEEPVINSRYSIVIATSKRAREIIAGDEPLVSGMEGEKPLSIAVKELYDSKLKILPGDDVVEDEENLSNEEFEELGEVDPAFTNVE